MKTINAPTLEEVNSNLLARLNDLIGQANDPDSILAITTAVAKLNVSWKGNDQFGNPESEAQKKEREQRDLLSSILTGEEINK